MPSCCEAAWRRWASDASAVMAQSFRACPGGPSGAGSGKLGAAGPRQPCMAAGKPCRELVGRTGGELRNVRTGKAQIGRELVPAVGAELGADAAILTMPGECQLNT